MVTKGLTNTAVCGPIARPTAHPSEVPERKRPKKGNFLLVDQKNLGSLSVPGLSGGTTEDRKARGCLVSDLAMQR
jgi:hypothetical protein